MNKFIKLIALLSALSITGCSMDDCRKYSNYSCKQLEQADYNVYFSSHNNKSDYHLGKAKGLSGCAAVARKYAYSMNIENFNERSYICCLITKKSSCAEKHR